MQDWQVAILVAFIGQMPVFVTVIRVLSHVRRSTDGLHADLMRDLLDLKRRVEEIERETGVIARAIIDEEMRGRRHRWLRR